MSKQGFLSGLNPKQLEAVTYDGTALLILAGAGSGKTRVITTRIAYLVATAEAQPRDILAVTFTNKAAREMRERASRMVPGAEEVMIRTFHSFCAWFLRRNGSVVGLDPHFLIYDDDDSTALVKALHPHLPTGEIKRHARAISRAKDDGLRPEDDLSTVSYDPDFPAIYQAYQKRLEEMGNADFGSLIMETLRILRDYPEIRKRTLQRFPVVLVDEYQDSNGAQHELLRQLVAPGSRICVVGDDDQSIYRFRGAEVKNIVDFPKTFPGTQVIRLEQNYRSTGVILDIASKVVSNNTDRLGKTLWTENPQGESAVLVHLDDQDDEARFVAKLLEDGRLEETAILYRTNAQSRAFETLFLKQKIPYRVVGTLKFYSREEVKDSLAYLALLVNPKDQIAFTRVVNKPARGLGKTGVNKIIANLNAGKGDYLLASAATLGELKGRARAGLENFIRVHTQAVGQLEQGRDLADVIHFVLLESGIWEHYKNQDLGKDTQKLLNLEELLSAAAVFGNGINALTEFLESIELDGSEQDDPDQDKVTLITMHNTKGLEFDRVIITGLEEGLFPRGSVDLDPQELEEERRLFYVAITRAREKLYFTTCSRRMIHGRTGPSWPSRFIGEIPAENLEVHGENPGFGTQGGGYPRGTRIYHDDYGPGVVIKETNTGGEYLVEVRFETGRSARFFPEYTPLEKIVTIFVAFFSRDHQDPLDQPLWKRSRFHYLYTAGKRRYLDLSQALGAHGMGTRNLSGSHPVKNLISTGLMGYYRHKSPNQLDLILSKQFPGKAQTKIATGAGLLHCLEKVLGTSFHSRSAHWHEKLTILAPWSTAGLVRDWILLLMPLDGRGLAILLGPKALKGESWSALDNTWFKNQWVGRTKLPEPRKDLFLGTKALVHEKELDAWFFKNEEVAKFLIPKLKENRFWVSGDDKAPIFPPRWISPGEAKALKSILEEGYGMAP